MGLQEKARQIMAPIPSKSEGDIAACVEKWLEGLRTISVHRGYEMSYRLRVTALNMLTVGRARDQFELWEEEYRDDIEDNWKKLLVKVHDYATRRRLEANYTKHRGEPMDVNEMDNYGHNEEEQWEDLQLGDVDAFGKAKGK